LSNLFTDMFWYMLAAVASCNFKLLVDGYKNLPSKPADCAPFHRGLGSVINHNLIKPMVHTHVFSDYSHCDWAYGCNSNLLFGRGGCANLNLVNCSTADKLSAAAHALLDDHKPRHGVIYDAAIHIRNGDKLKSESRSIAPRTSNASWWADWVKANVSGNVFIASDDCTIAYQLAESFKSTTVRCESKSGHWAGKQTYSCTQTMEFIQDIWTMVQARIFVGSLNSNIARLVSKLRGFDRRILAVPGTEKAGAEWSFHHD